MSTISREDLNNPPTAVGGILSYGVRRRRKDLNNPPTTVGGIRLKFTRDIGKATDGSRWMVQIVSKKETGARGLGRLAP